MPMIQVKMFSIYSIFIDVSVLPPFLKIHLGLVCGVGQLQLAGVIRHFTTSKSLLTSHCWLI